MFNKQIKLPEDMTDAEMHERLGMLKGKIAWIDKYIPRIAGATIAAGAIVGLIGGLIGALIGAQAVGGAAAAPLVAMSMMIGAGALSLSLGGHAKSNCSSEIWILSEENKHRIEMTKLRQKAAAAVAARAVPQSTLKLREEFDAAIEKMGKGIENAMTVRRPLRLKGRPGAQA